MRKKVAAEKALSQALSRDRAHVQWREELEDLQDSADGNLPGDLHALAVKLLEKHARKITAEAAELLRERLPGVAASQRPRLQQLLAGIGAADVGLACARTNRNAEPDPRDVEGGPGGELRPRGRIVAQGTPEHVAQVANSHTAKYLKRVLRKKNSLD